MACLFVLLASVGGLACTLVTGESTWAGDRDSRFLNCAVPCQFECTHPNVSARKLLQIRPVPNVMHKGKFIFHPADTNSYIEKIDSALNRATSLLAAGKHKVDESERLIHLSAKQPVAVPDVELPIVLKLLRWSCEENCRYTCMKENSHLRRTRAEPQVHYYGKWPFTRVLGVQELFSSLFSALNGLPYVITLVTQRKLLWSGVRTGWIWAFWCAIHCNTWLQSTVFHARESPATEALDYHGATLGLASSLCTVLVANMPESWPLWCLLSFSCIPVLGFWICHVLYLSLINFDYGYNMKVAIGLGASSSILWLVWFLRFRKQRPYAWKALFATWGPYLVLPLELFDFPPYWELLDAHSVWHALTVPMSFAFCSFLCNMLTDDLERAQKKE